MWVGKAHTPYSFSLQTMNNIPEWVLRQRAHGQVTQEGNEIIRRMRLQDSRNEALAKMHKRRESVIEFN